MVTGSRRQDVREDTVSPPLLSPHHTPTPRTVEVLMAHPSACHDSNDVMPRQRDHRRSHDIRVTRTGQRQAVADRDVSFRESMRRHRFRRSGVVCRGAGGAGSSALLTSLAVVGEDDFARRDCTAIPTTAMTDPITNARTKISSADIGPPESQS
jgi:hypothetical protein